MFTGAIVLLKWSSLVRVFHTADRWTLSGGNAIKGHALRQHEGVRDEAIRYDKSGTCTEGVRPVVLRSLSNAASSQAKH